jgi:tagatose-1,6-bisphosphate aldolase non-catalytic subunit AgaZ/GatZ
MTIKNLLTKMDKINKNKAKACTLLGVGPLSIPVLRAVFELGAEKDFPVMLIASRNQVDSIEFGGGYVCGWDQERFAAAVKRIAAVTGFNGLYYICRDHGGPWQRDAERIAKLSEKDAMDIAKRSFLADLLAGFNLLHIDPTKDPHCTGVVPADTVIKRTVELISYIEAERIKRGLPPVDYEVGTEETSGGLTSADALSGFIEELRATLAGRGLPAPVFIVGQTGTLVRNVENVGSFNAGAAVSLGGCAHGFGMWLKEHNADYLPDRDLLPHPMLGVAASNVAPEFGVAQTEAYLLLADIEKAAFERGLIAGASGFVRAINDAAVDSLRWRKWMTGGAQSASLDDVRNDSGLTDLITRSSGHYTFEDKNVLKELEVLKENLCTLGYDPNRIVLNRIKTSIRRYVDCFGLEGLTSLLISIK